MEVFRKLFKNKNFSLLWFGQFISALGDRFTQMALLTIAMILYADKGEKMAWITFYSLLPFLFFGPIFQVLADRLNRKKFMVAVDILRALLVVSIPFVSRHANSLSYIYLIIFCIGTLSALFSPAKMAIMQNLAEKEKLTSVNSVVASLWMFSALAGTLIAGYLIKIFGPYPMFYLDGFTFLISAITIANIFIERQVDPAKTEEVLFQKVTLRVIFESMKEALNFTNRHQLVLRIIQLNAVFSLLCAFFYINILNYSSAVLGLFSQGYGILLTFLGLGFCLSAIFLGKRIGKLNYNNILFVGFGIISITNALFLFKPDFKFSILLVVFIGSGASLIMITLDSFLQRLTLDGIRVSVFSIRAIVVNFVFLISLLVVGKVLSRFNCFYVFGFIWLVSFSTAFIIYLSEATIGYRIFRAVVRFILRLFFDLKVSGLENLPQSTKVILTGNHTSFMDGVIVAAAYPGKVYFLVSENLFNKSFMGFFARHIGFIPVKNEAFNEEAVRLLENCNTVGIFPEGNITNDGKLAEGKHGIAVLALKTEALIIHFAIEGAYYVWPLSKKYPKRHPIEIRFAPALDVKGCVVVDELVDAVMQEIAKVKKDIKEDGLLNVDPNIIVRHIINFG